MGIFDRFRKVQATTTNLGGDYFGAWRMTNVEYERILGLDPAEMWRTQPYLRTVVTFLARNIAQLGLHTFQREGENDRVRIRDGIAGVLGAPNPQTTTYELIYGLVADLALYDRAYLLLSDDLAQPLVRLPVPWVTPKGGNALGPDRFDVKMNERGEVAMIPAADVLAFHGWHPASLYDGSSPVSALREILAEQVQAAKYREMVWRRGGKVGAVLSRPPDAPQWSDDARKQFKIDWESKFTGSGPGVGGTPLLEDGMSLSRVDFSAHEMEFIEGSRLALNTVASVFHINPTMIGLLDNANYSNVREFRRMLYGDTLGPWLTQIETRINAFLVPRYDDRANLYVQFNIEEKLQGNFEEQTKALQSAIGRPWMTTNEGRALRNMPAIDGGDELVTPLNVLVGGQASPNDSAPNDAPTQLVPAASLTLPVGSNVVSLKSRISEGQAERVATALRVFLTRQGAALLGKVGDGNWWDGERWDRELADDLRGVARKVTQTLGESEALSLGYRAGEYNAEQTSNFLQAVAERYARNINRTTKTHLDLKLDSGGDPGEVFTPAAVRTRAGGIAVGVGTFLAGFATHEAAGQLARLHDLKPTKTWVATSGARSSHAALNGETVPLSEDFSNGMPWPGASTGDPGEVANCRCSLSINA